MSVVSGVAGAEASKSSANTQADAMIKAAEISSQTQMDMFERGVELTEPWRVAGAEALDTLSNRIAEGPGEFVFEERPGEVFAREESEKALERSAAARGGLLSGAAAKEMQRFASGNAAQRYDSQRANFLREYYEGLTPLQSLAGVGQSTASQTAGNAQATGANIGQTQFAGGVGAANAQAAGRMNAINAYTGMAQSTTNNILQGYNAWQNRQQPPPTTDYNQYGYGYGSEGQPIGTSAK